MSTSPSSSFDWSSSKLPQAAQGRLPVVGRKVDCGWYDSSFDLARGLEIVEQDDDALYQLWELSQR